MTTAETTVKLAVTVEKRLCRGGGYVARFGTYPHDIEARGATAAQARENLAAALVTAVNTIVRDAPRFARDDDGSLWAAIPAADGGSRHWRVTAESAWGGTSTSQPTSEAFTGCYHQTVIPSR